MIEADKLSCVKHGGKELNLSNFYMASPVSIYNALGYIPICKKCLYEMTNEYNSRYKDMRKAIYYICRKIDVAFNSNIYEGALEKDGTDIKKIFQSYMTQYNSLGRTNNTFLPFDDGEHIEEFGFINTNESKNNDKNEKDVVVGYDNSIKMSKNDVLVKQDVIKNLEFDPFEGYSETDQKFLYNDLVSYFDDEEILEDQFLISQIIQVVNNNNQIRKIDYLISQYTADNELLIQNESKVKSLNSIKKDIVQNNDKIAKENGISVKNRKGGNARKSSLTVMMEYLRELNFEDAEVDFYDQKKAYGMQMAADISMKAISEQIQFDENDINEIIIEQRNMIKEMEEKILDLEDKNRELLVDIKNYKIKKK